MRILIVDDHAILRRGIQEILEDEGVASQTGEAGDGQQTLQLLRSQPWDLVLLDINLPGRGGVEILAQIRREFPKLPVLIVSAHSEEQYALRMIRSGAQGYLTKESAPDELVNAVRTIAAGRRYFSPLVTELLADQLNQPQASDQTPLHKLLTNKEFEVFIALAGGTRIHEIADSTNRSPKTISSYRSRILKKMHARSNADLTVYATTYSLLERNRESAPR